MPPPSPPALQCGAPGESCWESLCCSQPAWLNGQGVYGCFKHGGASYAQCRPLYGWQDHKEVLTGVCTDGDWLCPESWMETTSDAQAVVPSERAHLPSNGTVLKQEFWDYSCAPDFEGCAESTCCQNPAFGCYKKKGKNYAMCKKLPPDGTCVSDGDWQCPDWQCSADYADCTSSLCCNTEGYSCQRRPNAYYAQCRPKKKPCTAWELWKDEADPNGWLCPGWEQCSGPYEECAPRRGVDPHLSAAPRPPTHGAPCASAGTLSRCCADGFVLRGGYACYLNKTLHELAEGERMYAQCRPLNDTGANGTSSCVELGGWLCPGEWMDWRDVTARTWGAVTRRAEALSPGAVVGLVLATLLGACCLCAAVCAIIARQQRRLRTLERELAEAHRAGVERARAHEAAAAEARPTVAPAAHELAVVSDGVSKAP